MLFELAHPSSYFIETITIGQIKKEDGTQSILIESFIERSKSLLASCIPNLNSNFPLIDSDSFLRELNANSCIGSHHEFIFHVSQDYIGLAHPTLSYMNKSLPTKTNLIIFAF